MLLPREALLCLHQGPGLCLKNKLTRILKMKSIASHPRFENKVVGLEGLGRDSRK